jgi:hypothetical protein
MGRFSRVLVLVLLNGGGAGACHMTALDGGDTVATGSSASHTTEVTAHV